MKKIILLTIILAAFTYSSFADHGPRIQFIHNVPAEAAASVDIWYEFSSGFGTPFKLFEGVNYKEATEYVTYGLIYGDLTFYVTPAGSNDISVYFFKETFGQPQIDYEETFVIVLTGDNPDSFDMVLNDGMEESQISYKTSVSIFHGSLDAPPVNIAEVSIPAGIIVNNLQYGESSDYLSLDAMDYVLQVQTTDGTAVADFSVPLSIYQGQALFVVATGYLDTTGVTPNNPFKLLAIESNGTVTELNPLIENASPARLQIIHNSAAEAASEVDVWITVDDESFKLLSNFGYKDATPYIDAPGLFRVSITAAGSVDTTNAVLHKNFLLNQSTSYVVVAAGDPGSDFDLYATDGLEVASTSGNTDVKVFHGSVGAPMVDIDEVSIPAGIIIDDLSFGEAQGYLSLGSLNYNLQLKTQAGIGAAEFSVPLSAFTDSVLFVAASGYLDTTGAVPNNPFKLLAITPSGNVVEINPNASLTPARIQIIHNSAIPDADFVDVYMNDQKILDDFQFRTATSFIEVPGATEFVVDIDTKASIDNSFPIYSETFLLASGRSYIVVASGVIVFGSESYFPSREFDLIPIMDAREVSMDQGNVDVMVFHGSTDAPIVDINELTIPVDELINAIDYTMYQGYLELEPDAYELEIALASSGTSVKTYEADLSSLLGKAITIVASGFLDPLKNNNGASFGLWVALPEGGDLIELPVVEVEEHTHVQIIHNSADEAAAVVDVWLDNILLLDNFQFRTATPFVDLMPGVGFTIAIKDPDSQDASDPIWSKEYNLEEGKTYVMVASGIVSPSGYDPATPFDIYVYDMGRETASMSGNTDLLVFHGSSDAPTVDIVETGVGAGTIVDDIMYGDFQGYLELPTADYQLSIKDETGSETVAVFGAPLATLGLEGAALVAVASGFLNPENNSEGPGFGIWAALPMGGELVELQNVTSVKENLIDDGSVMIYPNPTTNIINLNFSLLEDSNVDIYVYDLTGSTVRSASFGLMQKTNHNTSINLDDLKSGLYVLSIQAGRSVITRKIQVLN